MPEKTINKIKIALFVPSLKGGGAEKAMLNLANEFSKIDKFEIDLILCMKEGPYLSEVQNKIRIINLKSSTVPKSLFPLAKYLRNEKPAILISTLSHASAVSVLARIISRSKVKIIIRMANTFSKVLKNIISRFNRIILFYGVKYSFPLAEEIIAVSGGVADDLARVIKIPRDRIKIIPNSVDINKIEMLCQESTDHKWLKNKTVPVILAVGRLTPEKDYPTLIKAFSILSRENDFRLIILGEGKKRYELEEMIQKLNLKEKISMPGFVENPFCYIKNCDVFVLSSDTEGSPNTLIEAMACGVPVISTDCPSGPREILDNGRYGKLVKVGDEKALADAILETFKNPVKAELLKERIKKSFSLEKAAQEYLNVIQKYVNI